MARRTPSRLSVSLTLHILCSWTLSAGTDGSGNRHRRATEHLGSGRCQGVVIQPRERQMRTTIVALLIAAAVPAAASAHLERASYWPDPRPDTAVNPPAGGEVPKARTLASAVSGRGPGEVRVVCRGSNAKTSMQRLRKSLRAARNHGFRLRPSQEKTFYSPADAKRLLAINSALAAQCKYHTIQQAVFDSGNNDRVVIMPGRYPERPSRREPKNDPRC